jgi:hypothetical protein
MAGAVQSGSMAALAIATKTGELADLGKIAVQNRTFSSG